MPEGGNEAPKRILIEGAPGIGKTVLAKEIAYLWANGEILTEYKLVFLLYLRDPMLHEVKSINEILEHFTSEITSDLKEYVNEFHGRNVAFVLDGFDEYPVELQKESFITNLIKGKDMHSHNLFCNSAVIVTSRPTVTLFLHHLVDRRIEILGFPKEEREKYISFSLGDSPDKKQELDKYLKQHPIINSLCYIPLHLAILMYLFYQDSLPETLTEMNESFIINTIYRYLERNNLSPSNVVKKLKDFPVDVVECVYKLSKLAFKGLQDNQLVFTHEEIKMVCPEVDDIPGAIYGFGLLQAVQHYTKRGVGRTTSVNFLHFTMQEYLAALHVSTLSSEEQSSLMKETFWVGQFSFMWMMYVGIVGVKSKTFTSFIASDTNYRSMWDTRGTFDSSIYNDKRKYLHLFQCYMEAKSDTEIPQKISSAFTDGNIILTDITLLPNHISSLIFFMSVSSMQHWKILRLDHCNLGDIGMNSLLEHVIKDDENMSTLDYVDLSGNYSSPWSVYCAIIRHCCVNSLTLCGDEGMKEFVKEITDSLQSNTTLQSLTLCKIGRIGVQSIKYVLINNTTLKEVNMSSMSEGRNIIINRKLTYSTSDNTRLHSNSNNNRVVDINILYDGDCECSCRTISLSNQGIDDDAVCLITFGLYNNTTLQELDLSCNNITDDGAVTISDCFRSLQTVILSSNYITYKGARKIVEVIQENKIIRKLDVSHNNMTNEGAITISKCLKTNNTLQELNLSGNWITSEGTKKIAEAIQENSSLLKISISQNVIRDDGVRYISDSVKNNNTLEELNLSKCWITDKGAKIILEAVQVNKSLHKLDLSSNFISEDEMIVLHNTQLSNNIQIMI